MYRRGGYSVDFKRKGVEHMSKYFEWKDDYATGDSTVDEQHQYLFKLANRVHSTNPKDFIRNY